MAAAAVMFFSLLAVMCCLTAVRPVITRETDHDKTLEEAADRILAKRMESMKRKLDRLEDQYSREKTALESRLKRSDEEKEKLVARVTVLETRVRQQDEMLSKLKLHKMPDQNMNIWKPYNELAQQEEEGESMLRHSSDKLQETKAKHEKTGSSMMQQADHQEQAKQEPEPDKKDSRQWTNTLENGLSPGAGEAYLSQSVGDFKRADDFGPEISQMAQQLEAMSAQIQSLKDTETRHEQALASLNQATGATYIRWGNDGCPQGATTVYSGFVGGSWYNNAGAAANYLCLPHVPDLDYHSRSCYPAGVHGAEYYTCPDSQHHMTPACSLCHIPRSSSAMIAASNHCWPGWTREYSGYLMAGYQGDGGASEFICVDRALGYLAGTGADQKGRFLHYAVFECTNLSCPPYQAGMTVLCAVCSK